MTQEEMLRYGPALTALLEAMRACTDLERQLAAARRTERDALAHMERVRVAEDDLLHEPTVEAMVRDQLKEGA